MSSELSDRGRALLERRGINPVPAADVEPEDPRETLVLGIEAALVGKLGRFSAATTDHPEALAWAARFVADRGSVGNLLVIGPTGTGKTHLVLAVLRRIVVDAARRDCRSLRWAHASHPDFNAATRPAHDDAHLAAVDRYEQADVLVIDDLGAGQVTEWTSETLYRVIDRRWMWRRPTIVATNLPLRALRERVDDRIASRLAADATVITLKGGDRRIGGGQ